MNRKAFTLIELLVSLALFALITFFLFGAIDTLRKQEAFFKKKEELIFQKNKTVSLLLSDFDRAQSLSIIASASKDFDAVSIVGSNRSLYGIHDPFVAWVVLKEKNTLVRLESAFPLSIPVKQEFFYRTHSDVIAQNCEIFRVYDSPQHRLVYLKIDKQPPIMVEATK